MSSRPALLTIFATAALVLSAPLAAQQAAAAKSESPDIVGSWSGTATVPLGDSTIVVPVSYTFTQSGTNISGSAMVPGQGTGTIENVVREGAKVRFRVSLSNPMGGEPRLLDHEGTFGADGAMEGMVNLDSRPVAKFRITQAKPAPPK